VHLYLVVRIYNLFSTLSLGEAACDMGMIARAHGIGTPSSYSGKGHV
jgi:hypothetical protein